MPLGGIRVVKQSLEAYGYTLDPMKLHSHTITHKTDVGGVKLNLQDPKAIQDAFIQIQTSVSEQVGAEHFQGVTVQPMIRLEGYELIIGSSLDPQFGPVLLFGCGGQLVEVFKDSALALPPLTTTLARRMMEQTQIYTALQGVRGRKTVDLRALEQLLVHFSQLVVEQPRIKEIDINPLLASSEGLLAISRDEGLDRLRATILSDNQAMQHICRQQGFQLHPQLAEGIVEAQIDL